ncbi:MAG: site-specific integrase [Lachnospiraceae bacterium]|nr:site-specific integrase [Lachnospiraceae bacterium]
MKNYTNEMGRYAEYLLEAELSDNTKLAYLRQAKVFLEFIDKKEITKKETVAYKNYLLSQGRKAASTNLYISAVNSFLKFEGFEDCMIKTEKLPKRYCPENVISRSEYERLLEYAKESGRNKYYCIMRTLALTGIRISELSDCTVEALSRGRFITKNKGRAREVYLPDKLIDNLAEYCDSKKIDSGIIFRGNTNKAISRAAVYKMLIHIADMTGVPKEKVHPHSFRHLFAITYMEQYSNLFELADILGHSSLEVTRIYTASTAETKRGRMNLLML